MRYNGERYALGFGDIELVPIRLEVQKLSPAPDFSECGDWGIPYLICGALMGSSSMGAFMAVLPILPEDSVERLTEVGGDETYEVLLFAEYVRIVLGNTGLADMIEPLVRGQGVAPANVRTVAKYLAVAKGLNSYKYGKTDTQDVQDWATRNVHGWERLFYSTGLLIGLSHREQIQEIRRGIVLVEGSMGCDYRGLFQRFDRTGY